jgi:hypothetical protein
LDKSTKDDLFYIFEKLKDIREKSKEINECKKQESLTCEGLSLFW